jgi:hypothetical protein
MDSSMNKDLIKDDLMPDGSDPEQPDNRTDEERFNELIRKNVKAPEPEDNASRSKRETEWVLNEPLPNTVPNLRRVARGLDSCSLCNDDGYLRRLLTGKNTGATTLREFGCPCQKYKAYIYLFDRDVPAHDRHIRFDKLAPSEVSFMPLFLQEKLIRSIKGNPDKNWAMFGPAGWSKTTFCLALWDHAIKEELCKAFIRCGRNTLLFAEQYFPVWRVSAKRMLQEISEYENYDYSEGRPAEPTVTARKIRQATHNGYRPRLFIEEIDKINTLTKPRLNTLFELIQEIYANNGQVCLNSNMSTVVFESEFGPDFFRRVSEPEHSIVLNLFDPQLLKEK